MVINLYLDRAGIQGSVGGVGGWVPIQERSIVLLSPGVKWVKAFTLLYLNQVQMKNARPGRVGKNKPGKGLCTQSWEDWLT